MIHQNASDRFSLITCGWLDTADKLRFIKTQKQLVSPTSPSQSLPHAARQAPCARHSKHSSLRRRVRSCPHLTLCPLLPSVAISSEKVPQKWGQSPASSPAAGATSRRRLSPVSRWLQEKEEEKRSNTTTSWFQGRHGSPAPSRHLEKLRNSLTREPLSAELIRNRGSLWSLCAHILSASPHRGFHTDSEQPGRPGKLLFHLI